MCSVSGDETITINDRQYRVRKLTVIEAILWSHRVLRISKAGSEPTGNRTRGSQGEQGLPDITEVSDLWVEALKRCYTPDNQPLSDDALFDSWFSSHMHDLLPLAERAVWTLVSEFIGEWARYTNHPLPNDEGLELATPGLAPEGWELEFWIGRLLASGFCHFDALEDGRVSVQKFFLFLRVLDSIDYVKAKENARIVALATS